jgi:hypothetical protein
MKRSARICKGQKIDNSVEKKLLLLFILQNNFTKLSKSYELYIYDDYFGRFSPIFSEKIAMLLGKQFYGNYCEN